MILRRLHFLLLLPLVRGALDVSESLNAFSIDLLAAIGRQPGSPKNLALSGYTVWSLLSIIDEGAQNTTAEQLEKVLRIPGEPSKDEFRGQYRNFTNILSAKDQGSNLDIYDAIFSTIQHKLKPRFQNVVENQYGAKIQPIDFGNTKAASDKINTYVAQATKQRITELVTPGDLDYAQIFIVSTLYFKGTWMTPFNPNQTRPDTFYDEKQNKLGEVNMMYQMNFFPYARLDWIKGYSVELPYGQGDKMSMILILPYKDQNLQGMLQLMSQHPFSRIVDKLNKAAVDFEGEDVQVYLPKFKVASDLTLNGVLKKLGITHVFDEGTADLSGMFPHYLAVSRLIQRAEIEVNEEGTVASAASGASIVNKIPPPKFVANKPFLYFIVNKPTKSIIFSGKVTVPPKST